MEANLEIDCLENQITKEHKFLKILTCAICQSIFKNPSRINCGHTYCKICIDMWFKTNKNCPICRVKIAKSKASKDLIAENIINNLEVKCSNKGCPWIGMLDMFNSHKSSCYFTIDKIPEMVRNKFFNNFKVDKNSSSKSTDITLNEITDERNFECFMQDESNEKQNNINENNDENNSNYYKIDLKSRLYYKNKAYLDNMFSEKNQSKETFEEFLQSNTKEKKVTNIIDLGLKFSDENIFLLIHGVQYSHLVTNIFLPRDNDLVLLPKQTSYCKLVKS